MTAPSPADRAATLVADLRSLAALQDEPALDEAADLINDLLAAVERAETDADRLRSYAKHHSGCWQLASHTPGNDRCDCGLGTALRLHDEAVAQQ